MSFVTQLSCSSCEAKYAAQPFTYLCPSCGNYLSVNYDYPAMADALDRDLISRRKNGLLERWLDFLPIENPDLIKQVSLGESVTPLLSADKIGRKLGLSKLLIKNESLLPSGSLKDRSMSLMALKALELGYKTISIISSGNAAASLSAYAARAGLQAVVFVANGKPLHLEKCRAYGATVLDFCVPYSQIEELYDQAAREFDWFDCNGFINPYRLEAKKTLAHECAEALGWQAPGALFVPCGFGSGLVAALKGFRELQKIGWIDKMPKLYGAQPALCAPIYEAFKSGASSICKVDERPTVAEAIACSNPIIGGKQVLQAVRDSNGAMIAVSEAEICSAREQLAELEGIFVEFAGATSLAAVIQAAKAEIINKDQVVIASVTGIGIHDNSLANLKATELHHVEPSIDAIRKIFAGSVGRG